MTTDVKGNRVSLAERLEDIASRYGENSSQFEDAQELAKELASKGFVL